MDISDNTQSQINGETLKRVLSKMLKTPIVRANCVTEQLHGGTLGDVRLVSGDAKSESGKMLRYRVVLKTQKKWGRYGDPGSWRREYDLYSSDLGATFSDRLKWPDCYLAQINDAQDEIQIWMEYIDGVSGLDLTCEMYERAALELGRLQGRLYAGRPSFLTCFANLSGVGYAKGFYSYHKSWNVAYDYIRSEDCQIPGHLCDMLTGFDADADTIFKRIEMLPVVFCHRDFWVANIFDKDGTIYLIDWDTAGWGYLGEDIASLIADEADVDHMVEYYQKCAAACYRGFSEYSDITHITDNCIYELIIAMYGYRLVEWYLNSEGGVKAQHLYTLQKVFDMKKAAGPRNNI